jgi:hypothetical protein
MQATPRIGSRLSALGYVCIALLVGLLSVPARVAAQAEPLSPTAMQSFFNEVLPAQLEQAQIPGAALAVVKDGEVRFAQGYGYADLETRRPVDPAQTLFRTGSAAKPVTWTALMHLVEQGRIDLHADVNAYLDFSIPATFPEPITPAHLLSHTPGFADVGEGLFVLTPEATLPLRDYVTTRQPARADPRRARAVARPSGSRCQGAPRRCADPAAPESIRPAAPASRAALPSDHGSRPDRWRSRASARARRRRRAACRPRAELGRLTADHRAAQACRQDPGG